MGLLSRRAVAPAVLQAKCFGQEFNVPWVGFICEALGGDPHDPVKDLHVRLVVVLYPQAPAKLDLKMLHDGTFINIKGLVGGESCEILSVHNEGRPKLLVEKLCTGMSALV